MNSVMILDTLWVLIAALPVFFMNLGFATVESGFVIKIRTGEEGYEALQDKE